METRTAREIAEKQGAEKIVLVASRRTDMPSFYTDELINGLNTGVFHPQGLMSPMWELRFTPNDIHSVGLWSQDFSRWIRERHRIHGPGYKFWYRFTILPDDPVCKPVAPSVKEQLKQLKELVRADGERAVKVFIDPIMKYRRIGESEWKYNFSKESVSDIASGVAEAGLDALSISVIDYYSKVKARGKRYGVEFEYPDSKTDEGQRELIDMMGIIHEAADIYGVKIKTCCERFITESGLAEAGSCVDGNLLNDIFGPGASTAPDSGQRKKYGCGCTRSVDVGRYTEYGKWSHHCSHDCPQCYARK